MLYLRTPYGYRQAMRKTYGVLLACAVLLAGGAGAARAAIPAPPSAWYGLPGLNAGAGAQWVRAFAYNDPPGDTAPDIVYAGLEGGGVSRSGNGGATWAPFNGGFADPSAVRVRALLSSASGTTAFAGTDAGLFRSTGGDWAPLPLSRSVLSLVLLDERTLLAGVASGGVYRSVDGGDTWAAPAAGNGMPAGASITGLTVNVPGTVYAAGPDGVSVSLDGGRTWTRKSDGLPAAASPNTTWAYPARPSQLFTSTDRGGVYRSLNGGLTWAPMNDGLGAVQARALQIVPGSSTQGVHVYAATEDGLWEAHSLGSASPPAPVWHEVTKDGLIVPGAANTIMWGLTPPVLAGAGSLGLLAGTQTNGGYFLSFEPPDSACPSTPNATTDCPRVSDTTPLVGQTLQALNGRWTGTRALRHAYQWQRCTGSTAGTCTDIPDAEESTYVVPPSAITPNPNLSYRVEITATNPSPTFGIVRRFSTITSPAGANTGGFPGSGGVSPPELEVLAPGVPTAPQVGDQLFAEHGTTPNGGTDGWFSPAADDVSFRWLRCDADGSDCDELPGTAAGGRTYTLQPEDGGHVLRVRVTGSNSAGAVQLLSGASAAVVPAPAAVADPLPSDVPGGPPRSQAPTLAGDAHPGETLAGSVGGWKDPTTEYLRRWVRCDTAGNGCAAIQRPGGGGPEAGSTYVVRDEDLGSTLRMVVTADVDGDLGPDGVDDHLPTAVEVATAPSAVVAPRAGPPGPGPTPDPQPGPGGPIAPNPGVPGVPPAPTTPQDRTAPKLTRLKASKPSFVAGKGTTFGFTLSEPAALKLTITRATIGRRVGKACRPTSRANRSRRRCTYDKVVTTIRRPSLKAGAAKVAFSGKVGARRLTNGTYEAVFVATDAAGNASKPLTLRIKVVRRR